MIPCPLCWPFYILLLIILYLAYLLLLVLAYFRVDWAISWKDKVHTTVGNTWNKFKKDKHSCDCDH